MKHVITLESVHFVMKAEKILRDEGISVRLVPTPREISSDCGMSLEVRGEPMDATRVLLEVRGCEITGTYEYPDE